MGYASLYDVWCAPLVRDMYVYLPMVIFFFVAQIVAENLVLPLVPNWRRFSTADKDDLIIRSVSVVNGFIMSLCGMAFLINLHEYYDWTLPADLYTEVYVPFFPFFRTSIVAYFTWDLIVCFLYRWSWAWKAHALASLFGSYTLMFPFSDVYAGFYTGCFEMSNAFLHFAVSYRLIARNNGENAALTSRLARSATVCEYGFALLFTLIRVVGGSYVTYHWLSAAGGNLLHDLTRTAEADFVPKCHSKLAYAIAMTCISVVQTLQYIWFVDIVKIGLGISSKDEPTGPVKDDKGGKPRKPMVNATSAVSKVPLSAAPGDSDAAPAGGTRAGSPPGGLKQRRARKEE